MKTKEHSIIFNKEDIQEYVRILDDENPLYKSEESARSCGFRTIPLPPAMPMIVYKLIEIPWKMESPVIHRKQQCINHQILYIDEAYKGFITLSDVNVRKGHTFSKQTLVLYNKTGVLCFSGISHIVSGDLR